MEKKPVKRLLEKYKEKAKNLDHFIKAKGERKMSNKEIRQFNKERRRTLRAWHKLVKAARRGEIW